MTDEVPLELRTQRPCCARITIGALTGWCRLPEHAGDAHCGTLSAPPAVTSYGPGKRGAP